MCAEDQGYVLQMYLTCHKFAPAYNEVNNQAKIIFTGIYTLQNRIKYAVYPSKAYRKQNFFSVVESNQNKYI